MIDMSNNAEVPISFYGDLRNAKLEVGLDLPSLLRSCESRSMEAFDVGMTRAIVGKSSLRRMACESSPGSDQTMYRPVPWLHEARRCGNATCRRNAISKKVAV